MGRIAMRVLVLMFGMTAAVAFGQAKPVVVVAADGSGKFTTVQAALDAAPELGEVIRIKPGTYREKLAIHGNGIELRGLGKTPAEVVLTYDDSAKSAGGTGKSGSVTVTGDGFIAENLTIQNDWEKKNPRIGEGSQAVALNISGDREVLRHVRLLGYQDTLYAGSKSCHGADAAAAGPCQAARMLFEDCYIEGHVDFIFGDAKAAFKDCELHGMTHPVIALTAQSKLFPGEDSGYLFLDCTVTADVAVDKLYFGRPWRAFSTVYFVNTDVKGTVVQPEGWMEWKNPDGTGKLATSTYVEFGTHDANGPVKVDKRIAPSKQLTKAEAAKLSVASWLAGSDGWVAEAVR
jgi:pectinesterase